MRNIKLHFTPVGLLVFTYSIIYVLAIYGCSGIHSKFSMYSSVTYHNNQTEVHNPEIDQQVKGEMLLPKNILNITHSASKHGNECIDFFIKKVDDYIVEYNQLNQESKLLKEELFEATLSTWFKFLNILLNKPNTENVDPIKILQLNEWDIKFMHIIKMLFEVDSNPPLVTSLCKSIDKISSELVEIRNAPSDDQNLFDITKYTRCWRLVKCFLDFNIVKSVTKSANINTGYWASVKHYFYENMVKSVANNPNIEERLRQFDNDLNKILDGVFHYKNRENQNKKSKKVVYCMVNGYGQKSWSHDDCHHVYRNIYRTNAFSDILVVGNGSRKINQDSITKNVVKILSDIIDKYKDTSVVVEFNYHGSASEEDAELTLEKVIEVLLTSKASGFKKNHKSRVIVVADGCFSGRLRKYNQEENNQVYLIISADALNSSYTWDHFSEDRVEDFIQDIKKENNIFDAYVRFYPGYEKPEPQISGPTIIGTQCKGFY